MESKQEFIEHIQKLGKGHFHYLNALFERCPDYVIKHMRYMEIPKGYTLIQAGMPCEYVYIITYQRRYAARSTPQDSETSFAVLTRSQ